MPFIEADIIDAKFDESNAMLYVINKKNEIIELKDSYEPYYYAEFSEINDSLIEKIKSIKAISKEESYSPINALIEKKRQRGELKEFIKISAKSEKALEAIHSILKKMKGYIQSHERDAESEKKYFFDKKITFLKTLKFETDEKGNIKKIMHTGELRNEYPIMCFDIETYNPDSASDPKKNPALMISYATASGKKGVLTWKKCKLKECECLKSEKEMIQRFLEIIKEQKPAFLSTYNGDNFDLPYLIERAKILGFEFSPSLDNSKIRMSKKALRGLSCQMAGIVNFDLYPFIATTMGSYLKTEIYTLDAVSEELLGEKKQDYDIVSLFEKWDKGEIEEAARYCLKDSELTLKLCLKVIPLLYELSRITGAKPALASKMGYSKMVENYLMRKTRDFNMLIEKIPSREELSQRFRQTFKGGFVYEPIPGIYENLAVFDFKSLYPSIIVAHNICSTTINAKGKDVNESPKIMIDGKEHSFRFQKKPMGFLPTLVKDLIMKRDKIKEELKSQKKGSAEYNVLSSRQNAIKILANASWGYLGFPQSRWYSAECSASITAWGRQYINNLIKMAQSSGFKVIYGDTDSVFFILPKSDESMALEFAKKVNSNLPEMMELKFEGFFETGLFVSKKSEKRGAKKKYALYSKKDGMQIKGFELVRRDWSIIAKELQQKLLETILINKDPKAALELLKESIKHAKKNELPLEKFAIMTKMTKDSKNYSNVGPHVSAAMKAQKEGEKIVSGSLIEYVIAAGKGRISDKAYLLSHAIKKGLKMDADYYINNQLIPIAEEILKAAGFTEEEFFEAKQKTLEGF